MRSLFPILARVFGNSASQQRQRATRARRLHMDQLEARQLLATIINVSQVSSLSSYAGVGFRNNVVAEVAAYVNNTLDKNPSHFTAQIDWGDGSGYQPGKIVLKGSNSSHPFQIKGSHVYSDFTQNYDVKVKVTGQGDSEERETTTVIMQQMPSGIDGTKPPATETAGQQVQLLVGSVSSLSSYAGVGFELNTLATLNGLIDGQQNTALSNYTAYVNWGDSASWTKVSLAPNPGSSHPILIKGSHVYQQAGTYPIVVYAQGPDGTSLSRETTQVIVQNMPSGLGGSKPPTQPRPQSPGDVQLLLNQESSISAYAKVQLVEVAVGDFNGFLNGVKQTDPGLFYAQINWGDSTGWTKGVIEVNGSGSSMQFQILGTHTYNTVGPFDIVVYLNGIDGTSISRETTSAFVTLPKTPILTGAVTKTFVEDGNVPNPVAQFNGTSTSTPVGQLTATITYGDGSPPQNGTIVLTGGTNYNVKSPNHQYKNPGTYTSTVTVRDGQGNASTVTNTYTVTPRQTDLSVKVFTDKVTPHGYTGLNLNFFIANERLKVPVIVKNVGATPAQGAARIRLYLTTQANLSGEKMLIGDRTVNVNLGKYAQATITMEPKIPDSALVKGTKYYIMAKLDAPGINEFTQSNNTDASARKFEYLGKPSSNPTVFTDGTFFGFVGNALRNTPNLPAAVNRSSMTSFIGHFEGSRRYPYIDTEGHPSIGIGINLDTVSGTLKVHLAAAVRSYYQANYGQTLSSNDTTVINLLKTEAHANSKKIALTEANVNSLFAEALPEYITKARNALGAATYDGLTQHQKVAVVSMTYNLGSLSAFPSMVQAFKNGNLLQAGFQLVDAIRTTQAEGLKRRTGVEFANFFEGREHLLGKLVQ